MAQKNKNLINLHELRGRYKTILDFINPDRREEQMLDEVFNTLTGTIEQLASDNQDVKEANKSLLERVNKLQSKEKEVE